MYTYYSLFLHFMNNHLFEHSVEDLCGYLSHDLDNFCTFLNKNIIFISLCKITSFHTFTKYILGSCPEKRLPYLTPYIIPYPIYINLRKSPSFSVLKLPLPVLSPTELVFGAPAAEWWWTKSHGWLSRWRKQRKGESSVKIWQDFSITRDGLAAFQEFMLAVLKSLRNSDRLIFPSLSMSASSSKGSMDPRNPMCCNNKLSYI